jgi:hypothetical protein
MQQSEVLKKLDEMSSPAQSKWRETAEFLLYNHDWLSVSQEIATKILTRSLKDKNALSETTGIAPERIDTILKGIADITLSELVKLEKATGIEFLVKERKK